MLRKLLAVLLAATLTVAPLALAEDEINEDLIVETVAPEEPVVAESEHIRVTAEYLPEEYLTRYTAELLNNPTFADGTALTAQDVLFSLYVYLDPGYRIFNYYHLVGPVGLESYFRQVSEERLTAARETMAAIEAAGEDHVWSESDGWTEEHQEAYRQLRGEYLAACESEFANCAQAIVDYCAGMLASESQGKFGRGSSEIAADEGLLVAYAMLQWGYSDAEGSMLTARRSGSVWNLDEAAPSLDDFVHELSLAYDGDLSACWAVETTGTYSPSLPDLEEQFLEVYLGDEKDAVTSISGIRMTSETTIEVDFAGVNMQSMSLFNYRILSLAAVGDPEKWSPEAGLYGHDFGDISAIEAAAFEGPRLLEISDEIVF